jgi:hypothetical protein
MSGIRTVEGDRDMALIEKMRDVVQEAVKESGIYIPDPALDAAAFKILDLVVEYQSVIEWHVEGEWQ